MNFRYARLPFKSKASAEETRRIFGLLVKNNPTSSRAALYSVGAELRAAMGLMNADRCARGSVSAKATRQKLVTLLHRPACEPFLLSYAEAFAAWQINELLLGNLASGLLGKRVHLRTNKVFGSDASGEPVTFQRTLDIEGLGLELLWLNNRMRIASSFLRMSFRL